jgi:hypothetical protein
MRARVRSACNKACTYQGNQTRQKQQAAARCIRTTALRRHVHHGGYHTIFTCIDKTFFERLRAQRRKRLNNAVKRFDLSAVLQTAAPKLPLQPVSARAVMPVSARRNFFFKKNKISLDLHALHLLVLHIFQHQYHQTKPIRQKQRSSYEPHTAS